MVKSTRMAVKWKYSLVSSVKMEKEVFTHLAPRAGNPRYIPLRSVQRARYSLSLTLLEREIPRGFRTVRCQVRARNKCLTFSGAKR